MRNGNYKSCIGDSDFASCSYRTYEEWKQRGFITGAAELSVLTVPMRNGNIFEIANISIEKLRFLPYL